MQKSTKKRFENYAVCVCMCVCREICIANYQQIVLKDTQTPPPHSLALVLNSHVHSEDCSYNDTRRHS
jgi:predicted nucleic acid-binding protein